MFLRPGLLSAPAHGTSLALAAVTFALGLGVGSAIKRSPVSYGPPQAASPAVTPLPGREPMPLRTVHPAEVLRVMDGDTFEARVHLWPGLDITTRVRLRGIDAPEMKARCAEERAKADAAREMLRVLLEQGEVGITRVALDKYGGRVLADASTRATPDIATALVGAGLARRYDGGRRDGWCP